MDLSCLKKITTPFASTSEHVQGPGGNTSYKKNGKILIKASGFTFQDVAEDSGVVMLDQAEVLSNLQLNAQSGGDGAESIKPNVLQSLPPDRKPSMEFEFHALLDTFVLHTHSVYVNIITCSAECEQILSRLFDADEYFLVAYVTPGFPIAQTLLSNGLKKWPAIIFLKNHGIIIHGNNSNSVINKYRYAQDKIRQHFRIAAMPQLKVKPSIGNKYMIKSEDIFGGDVDLTASTTDLTQKILIPDQSIFFRGKVSDADPGAEIFINPEAARMVINGSEKFINAAIAMLQSVYFIKANIAVLGLTPDYIPAGKLDVLHGLSTEKYRLAILKNG